MTIFYDIIPLMSTVGIEAEGRQPVIPILSPGIILTREIYDRGENPSVFSAALVRRLAGEIVAPHITNPETHVIYYSVESKQIDKRLKTAIRQRRFNGRFGDERALIIPPDPNAFSGGTSALPPEDMRAFVGAIDLYSTGRGNIGTFSYRVDIALRAFNDRGYFAHPDFAVRLGSVDGRSIQKLLQESQAEWAHVVSEGLRTVFPAGLPGLGKR